MKILKNKIINLKNNYKNEKEKLNKENYILENKIIENNKIINLYINQINEENKIHTKSKNEIEKLKKK